MIAFRRRFIAGLLLILPFAVTFWIVYWLYSALEDYVIGPVAVLVVQLVQGWTQEPHLPPWFEVYGAPVLGIAAVTLLVYSVGFLAQSQLFRLLDRLLLSLPIVAVIHRAVLRTFESFRSNGQFTKFSRRVLVAFPHPGMRVPGFVTSSCRDAETQKTILCVYVPTTPIPSSGYMLLVPEEDVTELDWTLEETVQAVVSFGVTAPPGIRYYAHADAPLLPGDTARLDDAAPSRQAPAKDPRR